MAVAKSCVLPRSNGVNAINCGSYFEIPAGLHTFGVPEDAIPAMALEAAGIERLMRNNQRKLSAADIEKIYRAAY